MSEKTNGNLSATVAALSAETVETVETIETLRAEVARLKAQAQALTLTSRRVEGLEKLSVKNVETLKQIEALFDALEAQKIYGGSGNGASISELGQVQFLVLRALASEISLPDGLRKVDLHIQKR